MKPMTLVCVVGDLEIMHMYEFRQLVHVTSNRFRTISQLIREQYGRRGLLATWRLAISGPGMSLQAADSTVSRKRSRSSVACGVFLSGNIADKAIFAGVSVESGRQFGRAV